MKLMQTKTEWSPAALFLLAAKAARPSSLGDREYAKLLWTMLELAITRRMIFNSDEFDALNRVMSFSRSVGVFTLENDRMYSLACWAESGFAVAFEKAHSFNAWRAPEIFGSDHGFPDVEGIPGLEGPRKIGESFYRRRMWQKGKAWPRIGIGLRVKLPSGEFVRCTAIGADLIRFVLEQSGSEGKNKRFAFTRQQWAELFPKPEKA